MAQVHSAFCSPTISIRRGVQGEVSRSVGGSPRGYAKLVSLLISSELPQPSSAVAIALNQFSLPDPVLGKRTQLKRSQLGDARVDQAADEPNREEDRADMSDTAYPP
jgi:hypothetical protein